MICRFVGSALDLAQSIQEFIQAGRSLFAALKWLLSLTRSRAPESGVNHRILWAAIIVLTLVFVTSRLPVAIPNFGCAWVAGASTGQPAILARAKAGHKAC